MDVNPMQLRAFGFIARVWADFTGIAEGWDVTDRTFFRNNCTDITYQIVCIKCGFKTAASRRTALEVMQSYSAPELELRDKQQVLQECTAGFAAEAQLRRCPHWEQYLIQREDPEIVKHIERRAVEMIAEARFPDAERDRTGFAKLIREVEESIAVRYLHTLEELAAGVDFGKPLAMTYQIAGEARTHALPPTTLAPVWEKLRDKFEATRPWPWREEVNRAVQSEIKAHSALSHAINWHERESCVDAAALSFWRSIGGLLERAGYDIKEPNGLRYHVLNAMQAAAKKFREEEGVK